MARFSWEYPVCPVIDGTLELMKCTNGQHFPNPRLGLSAYCPLILPMSSKEGVDSIPPFASQRKEVWWHFSSCPGCPALQGTDDHVTQQPPVHTMSTPCPHHVHAHSKPARQRGAVQGPPSPSALPRLGFWMPEFPLPSSKSCVPHSTGLE